MKNIYKLSFLLFFALILCASFNTIAFAQVGGASVQTNSATNISNYQATLNGYLSIPYINSYNYVYFQWGTTTSYGYQTQQLSLNNTGSFGHVISGLSSNNIYHFRAVAQGSFGTIYGQDMVFYTNQYNYYNDYNCTYHAYKLCQGNNVYWYNSCGTQQELFNSCVGGQFCQYGQCTSNYIINPVLPPVIPNIYNPYYKTACSSGSIYWYDSLGVVSGLYKSCNDNNSCTQDTCSANVCVNTLIPNCQINPPVNPPVNNCGNNLCESTLGETNTTCPIDCKINPATALLISFFSKTDSSSSQWQKTAQTMPNSNVYFMISLVNNSTTQIDNVTVSANIPNEIASLGNLKLNETAISGDIVSGINIGSIAPSTTKSITFEGKTQAISEASTKQATATSNVLGLINSDTISIDFAQGQSTGAVSDAVASSGFWEFLKQWYLWILGILVLVFLFIIVFKRFSSDS